MVCFSLWLGWLPASGMYAPYGGGELRRPARPPGPARDHPRRRVHHDHRAAHALHHARRPRPGLRAHRARQGPGRARAWSLRHAPEERADPDRDRGRRAGGLPAGRRRPHRDRLRVARRGHADGPGHPGARLPARAGLRARRRAHLRPLQPRGRSALRVCSTRASATSDAERRHRRRGRPGRGAPGPPQSPRVGGRRAVSPCSPRSLCRAARLAAPSCPCSTPTRWTRRTGSGRPAPPGHPLGTDEFGRDLLAAWCGARACRCWPGWARRPPRCWSACCWACSAATTRAGRTRWSCG